MRCFFFNEMIENLNCQGYQIRQPIDKKHWQTEVLYFVLLSILSQMRHVCCRIMSKKLLVNLHAVSVNGDIFHARYIA